MLLLRSIPCRSGIIQQIKKINELRKQLTESWKYSSDGQTSFFPPTDSENTATTVTALLARLNSCCNPWIYMFFSGHLLQDCVQSFPCCQKIKQTLSKEDSNSNSRRQTSFTNNRSPTHSLNTWRESPHSKSTSFIPVPTWGPGQVGLSTWGWAWALAMAARRD